MRYLKFNHITFPIVPEEDWKYYFQDLVHLEHGLVFGDCIGECDIMPFTFEVADKTPIREKPIPYPEEARKWAREYCAKQVELGVMEEVVRGRDPDPTFVCNAVLVKEG